MDIGEVGDTVKFLGVIRTTHIVPEWHFSYLDFKNRYRILKVWKYCGCTYYKVKTGYMFGQAFYPIENFKIISKKELISTKYNLI